MHFKFIIVIAQEIWYLSTVFLQSRIGRQTHDLRSQLTQVEFKILDTCNKLHLNKTGNCSQKLFSEWLRIMNLLKKKIRISSLSATENKNAKCVILFITVTLRAQLYWNSCKRGSATYPKKVWEKVLFLRRSKLQCACMKCSVLVCICSHRV